MPEPNGVAVTFLDGGVRNYLPGPSHPGVSRFYAVLDGIWLSVHARIPGGALDGALIARWSAYGIRGYEVLP